MVLARIGPPARQVPLPAFVEKKKHTPLMDQDAFDGDGMHHAGAWVSGSLHTMSGPGGLR
jgi:hypothetical protein